MELKDYQASALEAFGRWLDALTEAQAQSNAAVAALENIPGVTIHDDIRNYPKTAWQQLAQSGGVAESAGNYVGRTDEAGRPIPMSVSRFPPAAARRCWPQPHWSGSAGRLAWFYG